MRFTLFIISFLFVLTTTSAQEDFLAKQYFADGEFEKALVFYEKLIARKPNNIDYSEKLVTCYQQLERYEDAELFLLEKTQEELAFPTFFIEFHKYVPMWKAVSYPANAFTKFSICSDLPQLFKKNKLYITPTVTVKHKLPECDLFILLHF